MGSPNEPPRHVDMKKWSDTWDRIRARQAEQRAEAEAAEPKLRIWAVGNDAVVDEGAPRYEFPAAED